jgi:alkylhydroperoxidase family enzyme
MTGTVFDLVPVEAMSPSLRAIRDGAIAAAGEATFVDVLANHPHLLEWYNRAFYAEIWAGPNTKVDLRSKELLRLRLSMGHGCHVCNSFNRTTAREAGFSDAQIAGIGAPEPGLFDDRDLAVIDLAAQIDMRNVDGLISHDLHDRLAHHYDEAQILELAFVGSILTGFSKFLFLGNLVSRDAACPIARPSISVAETTDAA